MNLTRDQIEAVKRGEPVRLSPPELGQAVVLIRSELYDQLAGLLVDWDPRLMRPHMARIMWEEWCDPEMRVYDQPMGAE